MMHFETPEIRFIDADAKSVELVAQVWGEKEARHMHITDGFSVLAMRNDLLVGLVAVYWRELPPPLKETRDAYVDILQVDALYRRRGIARQLLEIAEQGSRTQGMFQLRSWSSEDKVEAIPMWKALGYCLCPAKTFPKGQEVRGYFVAKML